MADRELVQIAQECDAMQAQPQMSSQAELSLKIMQFCLFDISQEIQELHSSIGPGAVDTGEINVTVEQMQSELELEIVQQCLRDNVSEAGDTEVAVVSGTVELSSGIMQQCLGCGQWMS